MNKTKTVFVVVFIGSFLLLSSCMYQISTIPKLKDNITKEVNKSMIGISAEYRMGTSKSKDVNFYFKNVNTNKVIGPDNRDKSSNNLYFNVDPGQYKILLITVREPTTVKSIVFNDSTITKTIGMGDVNHLTSSSGGISMSGVILLGDRKLIYRDTISNLFEIERNKTYYLGEYYLKGSSEGFFNDMPNITIKEVNSISKEKMSSFKNIAEKLYHNSNESVTTDIDIFNTEFIDLSKSNAINK